jgi:hypothetical protein
VPLAQRGGQGGFVTTFDDRKEFLLFDFHMLLDTAMEISKRRRRGVPLCRAHMRHRRIQRLFQAMVIAAKRLADISHSGNSAVFCGGGFDRDQGAGTRIVADQTAP